VAIVYFFTTSDGLQNHKLLVAVSSRIHARPIKTGARRTAVLYRSNTLSDDGTIFALGSLEPPGDACRAQLWRYSIA